MPPAWLIDLDNIDLNHIAFGRDEISKFNPQSLEMEQLDAIIWYHTPEDLILGYKDVNMDQFWVRGHIPERPLMPGVIMIESAAQLCSFYMRKYGGIDGFIGFSGIESAKFRGAVEPGCRLYLLGKILKKRSRQFTGAVQGRVDDKMVFDCVITGMLV